MKTNLRVLCGALLAMAVPALCGQTLLNVDFGAGQASRQTGFAAAGQSTNDFWNLYRHYDPRYVPGSPTVADGRLADLRFADGSPAPAVLVVSNAPGVWGNATGHAMMDSYLFSLNGSNMTVTIRELGAGRYHFYLYGHADPDVAGEQNSRFTLRSGTNVFGPMAPAGFGAWKAHLPWEEGRQHVVFRDVETWPGTPVVIEVAAGPNGIPVINGLQISSRGTRPPEWRPPAVAALDPFTNLVFREIQYTGRITTNEARFRAVVHVESPGTNALSAPLFSDDVAVFPGEIPRGLRLFHRDRAICLEARRPGAFRLELEIVPELARAEPWHQISFSGPAAAIASVTASAADPDVEVELMSGVPWPAGGRTNGPASGVEGWLGADRRLALRWRSRTAEVERPALVTVDSAASVLVTPNVVKYTNQFEFDVLQGSAPLLRIELPRAQALTRLQGDQIRDWQVRVETQRQVLTIEFVKAIEKRCVLTLLTEQPIDGGPGAVAIEPPRPLGVQRESGALQLAAEDTQIEIDSASGLHQVNAPAGMRAAFRFFGRPCAIAARVRRVEPEVRLADRLTVRLEETRLRLLHQLQLDVEKAGIYHWDLALPPGLAVSQVRGEGVDDWQATGAVLRVRFARRVLGHRALSVELEQPFSSVPDSLVVAPLEAADAARQTAEIGVAGAPGFSLKTAELAGLREIPATRLPGRTDELLAYAADRPGWRLQLAAEKLPPRVLADLFNLIAIGDGLVSGSATVRFGILNQGVQEFRLRVPAHWKNIEFTGAHIRRKESRTNDWLIGLQDKAWGAYTLVVTYDFPFDPRGAALDLGGIHALDVERETGTIAITTGADLELKPRPAEEPLRLIDESELAEADRALIARPVLLAYRYAGGDYRLAVDATRFDQIPLLDAVTDLTRLTTVLTEEGQMLTQASFMVKNNAKQSQRFRLAEGARFWSCFVDNQPAKTERDGDWLLVPLPRAANRDRAFAVDLVYAEKTRPLGGWWSQRLDLAAPRTDVPNTYAEWDLHVPASHRLSVFGGNMTVARGTTYELRDAWEQCAAFYRAVIREIGLALAVMAVLVAFGIALVIAALRRGWNGIYVVLGAAVVMAVLGGMLLPSLARAKSKATEIRAVNNLKQLGLAARLAASENQDRLPASLEDLRTRVGNPNILVDPRNGLPLVYRGSELPGGEIPPDAVLAYTPLDIQGRDVLLGDGSVRRLTTEQFAELERRGFLGLEQIDAWAFGNVQSVREAPSAPQQAAAPVQRPAAAAPAGPSPEGAIAPASGGVRPIRIEIPRAGLAYNFTKVLNLSDDPLTLQARVRSVTAIQRSRAAGEIAAFLAGLLLLAQPFRADGRRGFRAAVGVALMLGAVAHWLIAWRLLHVALILAAPCGVMLAGFLLLRWWWRSRRSDSAGANPGTAAARSLSVLLLLIAGATALLVRPAAASEPAASILAATYTGTVRSNVARFEAVIRIASGGTNEVVPLFGPDLVVERFATTNAGVRLLREGAAVAVRIESPCEAWLQCSLLARVSVDAAQRKLELMLPRALSSRLLMALDETEADVECPGAVAFRRTWDGAATRVEATLAAAGRLDLRWTPRMKRAAEVAATVFCQNQTVAGFGRGALRLRTTLDYQISQGELRQIRVRLPLEHQLLRVEGESIRTWDLREDAAGPLVAIELLRGVSPAYRLVIETESPLPALPARIRLALPRPLEVVRETGVIGLRGSEEVELLSESRSLQRIDEAEFARIAGAQPEPLASAFRFIQADLDLAVQIQPVEPRIDAVILNAFTVGADQLRLLARIEYAVKKAGVFRLSLALPQAGQVDRVSAHQAHQWTEHADSAGRRLELAFQERFLGTGLVEIAMSQPIQETPARLEVPGVRPLGTSTLAGYVSVAAETGLALRSESFQGLTEIPVAELPILSRAAKQPAPPAAAAPSPQAAPRQRAPSAELAPPAESAPALLAYKQLPQDTAAAAEWRLTVIPEAVESWLRAETVQFQTIGEDMISARALVHYEVANAPVKEFQIRLPAGATNVDLQGSSIRRCDREGRDWRIELQNKVRGTYLLTVAWEQKRAVQAASVLEVSGLEALGVERETGFLGVAARSSLQVTEQSQADLQKADLNDLPAWAGRADPATVLVFRYLRPGYRLALEARRFAEAAALQALVDHARLTTVVADDGQMMTQMTLAIRNQGQQFLDLQLPPNAAVWSAFVGGQPVRPQRRDSSILLPLERSGSDGAPIPVEIVFVETQRFPRTHGRLELASPLLDVPLKNARWELYLPPDFQYRSFGGSMARETADAAATPVLRYSISEYTRQESAKKAELMSSLQNDLSTAQRNLSIGNVREAVEDFNRARGKGRANYDETANEGLVQLETQLRRAQGSNLILGQNTFAYFNNGGVLAPQGGAAASPTQTQLLQVFDNPAAEQQAAKLQQAQELASVRPEPLHVNLPTRGVRLAFQQVLQTEIRKPMTIRFDAASTKTPRWTHRIGLVAAGFLLIWILTAWIVRPAARRSRA